MIGKIILIAYVGLEMYSHAKNWGNPYPIKKIGTRSLMTFTWDTGIMTSVFILW